MKRAMLYVKAQLVADLAKASPIPRCFIVSANALPDDATVVGGAYDSTRDVFELAIESESFVDMGDNEPYPTLPPPVITFLPLDGKGDDE